VRIIALSLIACLTGGCAAAPVRQGEGERSAPRIVSIDYCADQMVLGLVDRPRIAAVSVDVASDPAFSLPRAEGIARVRADVERVLALRPTLVVRSYGGGARFETAMRDAGVPVYTLPYSDSLASIRVGILSAGDALDARDAAGRHVAAYDASLAISAAPTGAQQPTALYITPGAVTTGPGSLIAEMMTHVGLSSYETRPGWHSLPLERMAVERPALIIRGFFESSSHQQDRWSPSGHSVARAALGQVPSVTIAGSQIACGNWLVGDALRSMAQARKRLVQ
jgi:iron complex transport system substrate-binding protein